MLTLKRIYLYAVLGIALAVMLVGLTDVVRVAFDRAGDILDSRSYVSEDMRTELSWALALVIVATPVFLVHLGLVRRSLRGPAVTAADERACASRATYFFIVLVATGFVAGMRLVELGETLIGTLAYGHRAWELGASAAGSLVIGSAWLAHVWARRRDLYAAPEHTAGDWLTRGYLYGALFTAALLACVGVGNVLTVVARSLLDLRPAWESTIWWEDELAWAVALMLVAAAAWAIHWVFSLRLLRAAPPLGEAHRASRTRSGYFLAVALASAAISLLFVSTGLSNVFAELTGTWRPTDGSRLLEDVGGPLLLTLPFVAVWWWHLRRAPAEALAFSGPELALATRRAGRLVVAFVGLAGLAIGLTWELQALLDAIGSAGETTLFSSDEVVEVSTSALAAALIGLAMWAPAWVLTQRDRGRDIATAATSTARRAYLYLVSGLAVVALMIALAFVIYQATRLLLDTELVDDSSWALAVLIVASVVLIYHLWCLRADLLVAREVEVPAIPESGEARVIETIEISAPAGADFKVLNAAIRTELPDGFELRVVSQDPSKA